MMSLRLFWAVIAIGLALMATAGLSRHAVAGDNTSKPQTVVRFSVNPVAYPNLPIFLAIDKGYFAAEGIELQVTKYSGSSVTQMPLAARGDLDITVMVGGPALFNQQSEGFDIKIIASMAESKAGWNDGEWVMVREDLWDSGAIRRLSDLKGRKVDGGPDGSPVSFLLNQALAKVGLGRGDVIYSKKLATPPDWIAAFRNQAADALAVVEPIATLLQSQGLAHKLVSDQDVIPWFQATYFIASQKYVQDNPAVIAAFLRGYLKAAAEVTAGNGKWTPDLLAEVVKWSKFPEADIAEIPGPTYVGQLGAINLMSLERQQDYLVQIGEVRKKIDVTSLVDPGPLHAARRQMGIE